MCLLSLHQVLHLGALSLTTACTTHSAGAVHFDGGSVEIYTRIAILNAVRGAHQDANEDGSEVDKQVQRVLDLRTEVQRV